MIKKMLLLLSILFVVISSLQAQTTDTSSIPVGYPIGTIDNPVLAAEYCTFLTDSMAPQAEATLEWVQEKFIGSTIPISVVGDPGNCQFLLTTGQMNELVKAVPTQEAQRFFNEWRKNPLSKELLSYLNDQVHLHYGIGSPGQRSLCSTDAAAIKTRYPDSKILLLADSIGSNYAQASSYYFIDEHGRALLPIPRNEMLVLDRDLSNFPIDYHRPITIQEN